jgi:fibronectin-binding autotransporter adhesin
MKIKTLFSAAILHTAFLFPQESWQNTAGSNWNNTVNWAPPVIPNGVAVTVTFGPVILAPSTVILDIPVIFGGMTFNSAQSYTISPTGANSFTLQGAPANITDTTGAHTISVPILLNNNLSVTQNSTGNLTLSGVISGTNSLTIQGAGTGHVVLSAANLYTGGTTVSAATLDCNATAALPAAGALTISGGTVNCNIANTLPSTGLITLSGGTLQLNDNSQSAGPMTGTSNIVLGVLPATILTSTTTATTAYSGVISGAGGFTLAGSGGVLTFSVAQTYTGGTAVNGSTLTSGINNALAPAANLTVNSPGIFNLNNFNQTAAVLAGSGSITLGSGNLTTNTATNSTFSGGISGTGAFTQAGASTLAFTGVNTYTGGTTVSNGTLQLGVNNALVSTGPVALSGGILDISPSTLQSIGPLSGTSNVTMGAAQLTINSTASSSYGGVMSGTGRLVIAGPQTLTLTNNNTFNGGTTINGGTLALGINNGLLPTGNLVVNSPGILDLAGFNQTVGVLLGNGSITLGIGTLTVNTPAMTTSDFSGVISQAGALNVGAAGTLILTGPNTYTGGTAVAAGATLQGTTTSLQGTINNAGSLIFNQPFNGTFSGSLLGAGALFLNGTGSVTLQGAQTQGSTTVNAGQLILGTAANLISSPVTIELGGALGTTGNGTITGNVTVNGTTQLGLGTLNVAGNYTQQTADSIFGVEVTPTTSGLLAVTGTATLLGAPSVDVFFQPGPFAPSGLYTLMTAGAPVAGTFAAPTFENPFFEGSLIYNGVGLGSVQLLLNIAPFGDVIKGGNAGAIAKCIDIQAFPAESDLLPIVQTLIFLPVDKVKDALEEMQPSQMKALTLTEENNLVLIRTAVSQHIDDLNKTTCNQCMSEMYKWNVWSNFSGDFLRQENQSENIGYDANTAAATLGMDIAVTKNLFLGLAGAYDYSWLTWNHSRGHGRISSYYAGPYFSWFNRRIFMSLSVLGTWNRYQASRHISFPSVDRHAKSHHHGHGLIAHYDIGVMMYPAAEMSFSPIAGLDYIHLHESGYTEHDAGSLNMNVKRSHADLLRSELGLKVAKCAVFTHHKWTHDLKLSWIHEHLFRGKHLHAKFTEVDCIFSVQGLEPNEDYFDVATGLTAIFMEDKLSASVRYEGKFGDGIRDNTGYVQLTYRF